MKSHWYYTGRVKPVFSIGSLPLFSLLVSKPPTWKCQTDWRTSVNLTYERHYSWSLRPYGKFYCWLLLHLHLVKGCQGYTSYLLIVLLVSISPSFPFFLLLDIIWPNDKFHLAQETIVFQRFNHLAISFDLDPPSRCSKKWCFMLP